MHDKKDPMQLHQAIATSERSAEPLPHWEFFAVRAARPSGFTWQWQKQGTRVPATSAPFDYYFDCISDARGKGYAGPLPAGPKLPLKFLPTGPIETQRVLASLPPKGLRKR